MAQSIHPDSYYLPALAPVSQSSAEPYPGLVGPDRYRRSLSLRSLSIIGQLRLPNIPLECLKTRQFFLDIDAATLSMFHPLDNVSFEKSLSGTTLSDIASDWLSSHEVTYQGRTTMYDSYKDASRSRSFLLHVDLQSL